MKRLIILFILAIVAGCTGKPAAQLTPLPSSSADIHFEEELKRFSLDYPAGWHVKQNGGIVTVTNFPPEDACEDGPCDETGHIQVELTVNDEEPATPVSEFLRERCKEGDASDDPSIKLIECKREQIDGETFGWLITEENGTIRFLEINGEVGGRGYYGVARIPQGPLLNEGSALIARLFRSLRFRRS